MPYQWFKLHYHVEWLLKYFVALKHLIFFPVASLILQPFFLQKFLFKEYYLKTLPEKFSWKHTIVDCCRFAWSAGAIGLDVMLDLPPFKIPLSCLGPLETWNDDRYYEEGYLWKQVKYYSLTKLGVKVYSEVKIQMCKSVECITPDYRGKVGLLLQSEIFKYICLNKSAKK